MNARTEDDPQPIGEKDGGDPRRARGWRRWWWLAALVLLVAIGIVAGNRWATDTARRNADRSAAATARAHLGLLTSELQKFRLLPLVLAEYPDVASALAGGDAAAVGRLDATLELLATRTDAAALYAIDARGRAIAASNWRRPASFVGQDYRFRRYFTEAMARGRSELFALGSVSGRPGLYLARRIDRGGRALGVIVVKVEFDAIERQWAQAPGATVVTDARGLILVTSVPGWRFHPTRALAAGDAAQLRASRQFGTAPPLEAIVPIQGRGTTLIQTGRPQRYRIAEVGVPLTGGRLRALAPVDAPLAAARLQALLWGLGLLLLAGIAAVALLRGADRRRIQRRAREMLEREVVRRTAELREANARLTVESEERAEADRRFRAAREELAQANRLGSLGQITAGVAHEINQPLAAIRTFAENAAILLERDARASVADNLQRIVALADRIGTITGELRAFARRRTPARGAPTLDAAIAGTLLLIGERARGIVVDRVPVDLRQMPVSGDRIRLEQILVNLIQNALDAVATVAEPRVTIGAAREGTGQLLVTIADTGGGVDPAVADILFTPFASAKPEGLGLGLAIARDIAREFGGDLRLAAGSGAGEGGATFLLTLRLA